MRQPLGPGDYLALATHYEALIIDAVPVLSSENYNHARRFITLIDALYEHRVKLVASAAAIPDRLYLEGDDTEPSNEPPPVWKRCRAAPTLHYPI